MSHVFLSRREALPPAPTLQAGDNPYFDEWRALTAGTADARLMTAATQRQRLIARYGYAVPDEWALDVIAAHAPIVELGAGAGYWAALLRARSVDVVALDAAPPTATTGVAELGPRWTTVLSGDATALGEYPDRTLLLCWPPLDDPMAHRALACYPGNTIIYVGEGRGGCCADETFFAALESGWRLTDAHAIPTWPMISDRLEVWRRGSAKTRRARARAH